MQKPVIKEFSSMKSRTITRASFVACTGMLAVAASTVRTPAATLAPLSSFGGGDGWRAPFEVLPGDTVGTDSIEPGLYNYLGNAVTNTTVNIGNLERGLAFNPTTGNLILVSRSQAGNGIRILDGATGVDIGSLNQGSGIISGGTFTTNMVGVGEDGAIYVSNLTVNASAGTPFKVYRWENEAAAAPTVAYDGVVPTLPGARLGDSFDVIGSGVNTRLVAGYAKSPAPAGNNSFSLFTTSDGATFSGSHISIASNPPEGGDFRLGITFTDSDTVIGKQGDSTNPAEVDQARIVDITGSTGTLAASIPSDGQTLRLLDYAVVGGRPLLAMVEASAAQDEAARSRLFVYDMTNPTAPVAERKIAEGSNLPFTPGGPNQFANGNSTGSVKFGAVNGDVVTIYVMSTNNGIQAFNLTLDPVAGDNADFNNDGVVDGADFLTWQRGFGVGNDLSTGDANGDSVVDAADLDIWKNQFGSSASTAAVAQIPEPAAAALVAIGGVGMLAARRRRFVSAE
jgi:hypothetical protein